MLPVYFRIIGFGEDPLHPTRPPLVFAGEVRDGETMLGRAQMTPDNHLRWKWVRLHIDAYWYYWRGASVYLTIVPVVRGGRAGSLEVSHSIRFEGILKGLIDCINTPLVVMVSRLVGCGRLMVSSEAGPRSSTINMIQSVSSKLIFASSF